MVWVIMFIAVMVFARYGVDGLKDAGTLGAMVTAGLGVHSFLNTFWRRDDENKDEPERNYWDGPGFSPPRPQKNPSLSSDARRNFMSMPEETPFTSRRAARRAALFSSEAW